MISTIPSNCYKQAGKQANCRLRSTA